MPWLASMRRLRALGEFYFPLTNARESIGWNERFAVLQRSPTRKPALDRMPVADVVFAKQEAKKDGLAMAFAVEINESANWGP